MSLIEEIMRKQNGTEFSVTDTDIPDHKPEMLLIGCVDARKDPAKDLVNFEIQEPVQLNAELQERTIWNLSNAKKKGASAAPLPANDSLYRVFSYQVKQGNEHWVNKRIK
jgi:hypothetical protein